MTEPTDDEVREVITASLAAQVDATIRDEQDPHARAMLCRGRDALVRRMVALAMARHHGRRAGLAEARAEAAARAHPPIDELH